MLDNFCDILASQKMYELLGPGAAERWLYWRSRTREQVSLSLNCWEKTKTLFLSCLPYISSSKYFSSTIFNDFYREIPEQFSSITQCYKHYIKHFFPFVSWFCVASFGWFMSRTRNRRMGTMICKEVFVVRFYVTCSIKLFSAFWELFSCFFSCSFSNVAVTLKTSFNDCFKQTM